MKKHFLDVEMMLNKRLIRAALRTTLIIFAYYVSGKLGMALSVPPKYATIVWPPSGIAIGMLVVYGLRYWPAILLGALTLQLSVMTDSLMHGVAAVGISIGATVQSIFGYLLIKKITGIPLKFSNKIDVIKVATLVGPICCLVSATFGTVILWKTDIVPLSILSDNWLTWWLGDLLGVAIFLPLVLITPTFGKGIVWQGRSISNLPIIAFLTLVIPLGLTFYAWKIVSERVYKQNQSDFHDLAQESEKALIHRMESYEQAILGGAGFFNGSKSVSMGKWAAYVNTINVKEKFPGINGIGYIARVDPYYLEHFVQGKINTGFADFSVHPHTEDKPYYIIEFIEPIENNKQALGLNIGFEERRQKAAEHAIDTGKSTLTNRILLVQDNTKSPGFLLLHPMYRQNAKLDTVQQRRDHFLGWAYAPFVGVNLLSNLTRSQGDLLNIEVYDGTTVKPETQIFSNTKAENTPAYTIEKRLNIMQRTWTLRWTSTPGFEKNNTSKEPLVVLISGFVFTLLFAMFLISLSRRAQTVQRLVEEQRLRLLRSESNFRLLVEGVNDYAIYMLDREGLVKSWNAGAQRIFGYDNDEIVGQSARIFHLNTEKEEEKLEFILSAASCMGQYVCTDLRRKRDGNTFFASTTVEAIYNEETHSILGYAVIIRDITKEKQASEEIKQAHERAEIATRLKSDFLANMSHEIRTPMNGVIGMANVLENTKLLPQQKHYVQTIKHSANALLNIINDILDLSKIEAQKMELETIEFSLHPLLRDVTELMAVRAREKNIELILDFDYRCAEKYYGDPGRIKQILFNLCGNAIKFTNTGHVLIKIKAFPVLSIEIIDTGIGIAEDKLSTVFNKFDQADSGTTRNYGGTGLGLSICQKLVCLMGGQICVESQPGKGSCFSITLPLEAVTATALYRENPCDLYPDLYSRKTLVFEPQQANSNAMKNMLTQFGLHVDIVETQEEAFAYLQQNEVEFLLVGDGIETSTHNTFIQQAKMINRTSTNIYFILVTGALSVESNLGCIHEAGFDAYLAKPVYACDILQIMAHLQQHIRHDNIVTLYNIAQDEVSGTQDILVFNDVHILVAEDNFVNQEVMSALLRTYDIKTTIVSNGVETLDAIEHKKEQYDLIFMDCQMPKMDGFEATRHIRKMDDCDVLQSIPIIALTANAMKGDREKCLMAGMNDYMTKPVEEKVLEKMLLQWLPEEKRNTLPINKHKKGENNNAA